MAGRATAGVEAVRVSGTGARSRVERGVSACVDLAMQLETQAASLRERHAQALELIEGVGTAEGRRALEMRHLERRRWEAIARELGYDVKIVNGVPSFCAASAELGDSLADRSEQLHIIPSTYEIEEALELSGTKVLMKAASRMPAVKEALRRKGLRAAMVENCGMENQKIYTDAEEIPEEASYYSLVVVKDGNHD